MNDKILNALANSKRSSYETFKKEALHKQNKLIKINWKNITCKGKRPSLNEIEKYVMKEFVVKKNK